MKTKHSFRENLPLILAFALPILIMLGIFAGKELWPFGDNCFLRTDLYHQYLPFFKNLGERLREGGSLLYAFDIGLGTNYTALFAYYLCGPLHLLAFLIPGEYMIEFVTGLIVLKIGLCGWAMAWYLAKRYHTRSYGITVIGVCYALSGYLAAYSWNVMWLDVLWLSVLVLYGLEKLVNENKPLMYCITLALAILCNYYISIMLCIFLVLYFINRLLAAPKVSGKQLLIKIANFAFFSLLAGAMAAVLVIPAAYALQGTASANSVFPKTISNYFSIVEMLSRHLLVVDVEIGLDHWPNIYSGVLVFLLVPLYYMNKRVSFREKIANTMLLGFMLLSFNTNMLNFIWHGFHYPNSLPCRQSYLYTFIILVMCFEGYRQIEAASKEQIVRIMWGSIGVILLVELIADSEEIPYYACYASIAFIALYTLFIYLQKRRLIDKNTGLALTICLLIVEMGLNTAVTSVTFVNRSEYMRQYDSMATLAALAEKDGDPITRIERQYLRTKNDGVLFGYNSASIFSSTTNAAISEFYRKMGLEGNTNAYAITGGSAFMWSFLHIGYKLTDARLPDSPLYQLIDSAPDRKTGYNYLYRNLYTLPFGYLIPSDMNKLWSPNASQPVRSQNSYINLAAGVDNVFETVPSNVNGATMTAKADKAGHYYAYVSSSSVKKVTASVNNQNSRVWDSINRNYLVDYGYLEEGDDIKLVAADVSNMSVTLYHLNFERFAEAIEKLSSHPFTISEFTNKTFKTQISGTVDADKESLLVWSIPIENGWTVKVDGQVTEVTPLAESFLAVTVGPGHHEVVLSYVPEGLPTGILLSVAGLAIFLIAVAVYTILKASRRNTEEETLEQLQTPDEEGENNEVHFEEASEEQAPAEKAAAPLQTTAGTVTQPRSPRTGRERIATLHQFDVEERARDNGKMPVIAFTEGNAYPRFVSPAERQEDEKLLLLDNDAPVQHDTSEKESPEPDTAPSAEAETADEEPIFFTEVTGEEVLSVPEEASEEAVTDGTPEEIREVPADESILSRPAEVVTEVTQELSDEVHEAAKEASDALPEGAEKEKTADSDSYLGALEDLLKRTEDSLNELTELFEEQNKQN